LFVLFVLFFVFCFFLFLFFVVSSSSFSTKHLSQAVVSSAFSEAIGASAGDYCHRYLVFAVDAVTSLIWALYAFLRSPESFEDTLDTAVSGGV